MPAGLPLTRRPGMVDDGDQPVAIVPDIEHHVAAHRISILEHAANFFKVMPANRLDNARPRFDFVRRIREACHCLTQMLPRNDVHFVRILHNM